MPHHTHLIHLITDIFQSDPGDAFNQFWNIMQGMLDNLSQPVAFATAPLGHPEVPISPSLPDKTDDLRRDGSLSSDTDLDEPIFSKFTRRIGISREGSKSGRSSRSHPSNGKQPEYEIDGSLETYDDDLLEEGYLFFSPGFYWKAIRLIFSFPPR